MAKTNDKPETNELAARVEELTADLQRVQAEFLNYKRRVEEEKSDLIDFAKTRVVREFLTVRDNFDREITHRPADMSAESAASIDAIRSQFDKVLNSLGVQRFESVGHAFDPHHHEAIATETGEGEHEVVIEEFQPGYQLGDRVLRPATVKVGNSDEVVSDAAAEPLEVIEAEEKAPEEVQPNDYTVEG